MTSSIINRDIVFDDTFLYEIKTFIELINVLTLLPFIYHVKFVAG